jgi:hypothetical protein
MSDHGVEVRSPATPEEIAAVLAALQLHNRSAESDSTFERWRRQRQEVLRDNR